MIEGFNRVEQRFLGFQLDDTAHCSQHDDHDDEHGPENSSGNRKWGEKWEENTNELLSSSEYASFFFLKKKRFHIFNIQNKHKIPNRKK